MTARRDIALPPMGKAQPREFPLAHVYRPGPPLAELVDRFWLWDGYTAPRPKERLLPMGTLDIVINLQDDHLGISERGSDEERNLSGMLLCGAHSSYAIIETPPRSSVMGVHFKPGGAFPFFEVPAGELCDHDVSLEALWGSDTRALHERLHHAPDPASRFRLLEAVLLERLRSARQIAPSPVVAHALHTFDASTVQRIASVVDETGLSAKRFIAAFRDEVGLSPKLYCRIRRFQETLRRIAEGQPIVWAEIALDSGYFDQAHFNRDFRAFTGLSPRAYLAQGIERPNHVPLTTDD